MKLIKFTIFLLGVLNFYSCETSNLSCGNMQFRAIDFSEISDLQIVNEDVEDLFLVINSQEEFENKINFNEGETSRQFNIDYSSQTLLVGKVKLTGIEGKLIEQGVVTSCETKKVVYKLVVEKGGYTALGNFYFGVVIPKTTETEIIFNVTRI